VGSSHWYKHSFLVRISICYYAYFLPVCWALLA
jgi:hypothetical protein